MTPTGSGPWHVVVIPPKADLLVGTGAQMVLAPTGRIPPSRPSADLLLAALAMTVRDRVLAVVLTGMGHDGAVGVTAVKRTGGVVVVQDQATSQEFGMPGAAIAAGGVDAVLALDEMSRSLLAVLQPRVPVQDRAHQLAAFEADRAGR